MGFILFLLFIMFILPLLVFYRFWLDDIEEKGYDSEKVDKFICCVFLTIFFIGIMSVSYYYDNKKTSKNVSVKIIKLNEER